MHLEVILPLVTKHFTVEEKGDWLKEQRKHARDLIKRRFRERKLQHTTNAITLEIERVNREII